jgi:hypothetical protein
MKIGKSARYTNFPIETPGPGTYKSFQTSLVKTGPTIGNSQRTYLKDTKETPGPGAYEYRPKSVEGPRYSMVGKVEGLGYKNNPGPGQYENDLNDFTSRHRVPSYTIGNESKTSRPCSAITPGPGSYQSEKIASGPKWKFGSQSRDYLIPPDNLGPGCYNIPKTASKGITMSSKTIIRARQATPGPGSYNPGTVRPKSPTWKIGTSARDGFKNPKNPSPGPGDYSYTLKSSSSVAVFGRAAKKSQFEELNDEDLNGNDGKNNGISRPRIIRNPGPGQYDIQRDLAGPRWHFGTASREGKIRCATPGPGTYSVSSTLSNLPNYAKVCKN